VRGVFVVRRACGRSLLTHEGARVLSLPTWPGRCSQLVPLLWGSDHVGLGAGGQSVEVVCRFGSYLPSGDPNLWRSSLPTSMNVASRPTTG